jgi:hypothetical protein
MNPLATTPRLIYPGIINVNPDLLRWREIETNPGAYFKVLAIQEKFNRVDFLYKQDPGATFKRHSHRCTVITYTIDGEWGYRETDEVFTPGCFAFEDRAPAHTPYCTDKGMVLYGSFQGDGPVFLELLDERDQVTGVVDIETFRRYYEG